MAPNLINGINWVFVMGVIAGLIGIIFFIPGLIVVYVNIVLSKQKDGCGEKDMIKKGILFSVLPFMIVTISLIGLAIVQALKIFMTGK
jgi:hypothetical protein